MKKILILLIFALSFSVVLAETQEERLMQTKNQLQEELTQRRQRIVEEAQEKLQEARQIREQVVAQVRENFQEKVEEIKNERAQQLSLQMENRFMNISDRLSSNFINLTTKMREIANKIEDRSDIEDIPAVAEIKTRIDALEQEALNLKTEVADLEFTNPEEVGQMFRLRFQEQKERYQDIREKIAELRQDLTIAWQKTK
jgi:hypothetical protein